MVARSIALALLVTLFADVPAEAAKRKALRHHSAATPRARVVPNGPRADDLYRRRGYGTGGLAFGLGQGGTSMAGACADLAFARPLPCEPGGGYGLYGNGLGYGFGF